MTQSSNIEPDAFVQLLREEMALGESFPLEVVALSRGHATLRLGFDASHLRAGGTISGPTMFTLADVALYAAVLSEIGRVPLAVTTDMSIHFLRRPQPAALLAEAKLLTVGSKLIVGDVHIRSEGREGDDALAAHAVGTYAVPRRRG